MVGKPITPPGYVTADFAIKARLFLRRHACPHLCWQAGADGRTPLVQRRFHDSPNKQQNGDLRSSVLAKKESIEYRISAAGDYRVVTDEELIEGLSFPVYRRVATMIFLPAESGSTSTVEMVTIDPQNLQPAQELDLNHGA
jgi:hypothetical protein